jgi:hypothetical protein
MPRSTGLKKTGGRAKGTPNKRTAELVAAVSDSGVTPLEFMLQIMRKPDPPKDADAGQILTFNAMRFEAAKAAAPYVHARLAAVQHTGKDGAPLVPETPVDMVDAARRICFMLSAATVQIGEVEKKNK